MLDSLFHIMLANTVVATCLAAIAAGVARLHGKPPLVYLLWLLVLVKLVTPPLVSIPLPGIPIVTSNEVTEPSTRSLAPIVHSHTPRSSTVIASDEPQSYRPLPSATESPMVTAQTTVPARYDWMHGVTLVWCCGTLVCVTVGLRRISRFHRLLRLTSPATFELRATARTLAKRLGVKCRPTIRVTKGSMSPLVWCPTSSCSRSRRLWRRGRWTRWRRRRTGWLRRRGRRTTWGRGWSRRRWRRGRRWPGSPRRSWRSRRPGRPTLKGASDRHVSLCDRPSPLRPQ